MFYLLIAQFICRVAKAQSPNLIQAIDKQMRFELLQIRNALCSQSTELELTPDVRDYLISTALWRKWSPAVRDRALKEFLLGNTPFQLAFDVSADGNTFLPKKFSRTALKPGTFQRRRKHAPSTLIRRRLSCAESEYVLIAKLNINTIINVENYLLTIINLIYCRESKLPDEADGALAARDEANGALAARHNEGNADDVHNDKTYASHKFYNTVHAYVYSE